MALVDDNVFPKVILDEGAAPATPASGQVKVYAKVDGLVYSKDDAGTETGPFGGSGVADIVDIPTAETDDTLVLAPDGAGGVEFRAESGGAGSVPWAMTYSTGSDTPWASSSSGTTADIDATNGILAVTVPASGKLLVMIELDFSFGTANNGGFIVLRTGSTDLMAQACISGNVASAGIGAVTASAGHFVGYYYVTGLTPGALTLKAGFRRLGSTVLNVYANDGAGSAGHLASPFVMVAWAA